MPGTKDSAVVTLKMVDGSQQLLVFKFAEGKLTDTNQLGADKKKSVTLVTGCKNTDDTIVLEQACADERCEEVENEVSVKKMTPGKKIKHEQTFRFVMQFLDAFIRTELHTERSIQFFESTQYRVHVNLFDGCPFPIPGTLVTSVGCLLLGPPVRMTKATILSTNWCCSPRTVRCTPSRPWVTCCGAGRRR